MKENIVRRKNKKYIQKPLTTKLAPILGRAIAKSGRTVSTAGTRPSRRR